jgi:hypothetical protein
MRMDTQSEVLNIQRAQYCSYHVELMDLHDQNTYECGQWWPAFLLWVPESFRALLRPWLREGWDMMLKARGHDFSTWRWWPRNVWDMSPDDVFELRQAAIRRRRESKSNGHGGQNAAA